MARFMGNLTIGPAALYLFIASHRLKGPIEGLQELAASLILHVMPNTNSSSHMSAWQSHTNQELELLLTNVINMASVHGAWSYMV